MLTFVNENRHCVKIFSSINLSFVASVIREFIYQCSTMGFVEYFVFT